MIISVKVPAHVFFQAANVLKINDYYLLHVDQEEMFVDIDGIRRLSMAAHSPFIIIRVVNVEDESKWFLSQCERLQSNVMKFSWDILLTGITEVTNQAALDLLNMNPYNRHGDAWWDIVEERAREAFRTHSTDARINLVDNLVDELVDYRHPHRDGVDSLVDVSMAWYNDPTYQMFLSSTRPQPSDPIGFAPRDYVTSEAPIIKVKDDSRFEEPKDTKPQMSINELLFGGD